MRNFRILLFCILLKSVPTVASDNLLIDTLLMRYKTAGADTVKIKLLNDLSWQYKSVELDSSFFFCDSAYRFSQRINYITGIAKGLILRGVYNTIAGRYDSAEASYRKCMQLRQRLGDSSGVAACLHDIGNVHLYSGDLDSALYYFLQSVNIEEKFGTGKNVAEGYLNIGDVYLEMENYDKALEFFLRYIDKLKNHRDDESLAEANNNIGTVYFAKNDYTQAARFFNEGLTFAKSKGNKYAEALSLSGLARIEVVKKNISKAIPMLEYSVELIKVVGSPDVEALLYSDLADAYLQSNDLKKAEMYAEKGIEISKEIGAKKLIRNISSIQAKIFSKQHNFAKAFTAQEMYINYNDSVMSEKSAKTIAELQARFDVGKKEAENKLLLQDNTIKSLQIQRGRWEKILLILLILVLGIAAYLFNSRRKAREEKRLNTLIMQEKEARTRKVLEAEEQERMRIARELHDGVGQILSAAKINLSQFESDLNATAGQNTKGLKTGIELIDESVREIRTVSHNLMPNVLAKAGLTQAITDLARRIGSDKLKISTELVGINDQLDLTIASVLYRVIQEMFNNILKHSKATEVDLQLIRHENELVVMMEDNGVGFDPAELKGNGIGLKNIHSRIALLNGHVVFDSRPGRGTIITIEIPIRIHE